MRYTGFSRVRYLWRDYYYSTLYLRRILVALATHRPALTTNAYSNTAKSNATASNLLGFGVTSALGKVAETLYASMRLNSASLSADAPPTVANLQARMDATSRLKPDGIDS